MKTTLKIFLLLTAVSTTLAGCTKLLEECKPCGPLPAVELPVKSLPWEPPETDCVN